MKATLTALTLAISLMATLTIVQDRARPSRQGGEAQGGREPPPQAYADCRGKNAGDTARHATRDGTVAATCTESANGLVVRPTQGGRGGNDATAQRGSGGQPSRAQAAEDSRRRYSLEQAISDRAQLNTIAFDGLAFLTGDFRMKTAPAMGKRDHSISTTLTGNSGEIFLAKLNDAQRRHVTALPDLQRQDLAEIVRVRQSIATEPRRFLKGETADQAKVLALSKRYGELDGEMS